MSLIAIEGVDGSGKTTQINRILSILEDTGCKISLPNKYTNIGRMLNQYLKDDCNISLQSIHLLFTANRWECTADINAKLKDGKIVLLDRWSDSGIAYSMASGLSMEWCLSIEKDLPKPDSIIYLDLPPAGCIKRIAERTTEEKDHERYDNHDFQSKVYNSYAVLKGHMKVIDATLPVDTITEKIMNVILDKS